MNILGMSVEEHNMWITYLAESASLLGNECSIYLIKNREDDINNDPYIEYYDPVKINILFDKNPKSILKKLGWYTEDDKLPYIAYLTCLSDNYKINYPQKYSLIEVPNTMINSKNSNKFVISDIKGSKINPLFWICKLVPYRYNLENEYVNISPDLEDNKTFTKYKYLIKRT